MEQLKYQNKKYSDELKEKEIKNNLEKQQIQRDKFSEIVKLHEEITNVRDQFKGYQ